jgi:hypothetical protein
MSFTKDNGRQIEDNYGNSDSERAKSLSIAFGLKETAPLQSGFRGVAVLYFC